MSQIDKEPPNPGSSKIVVFSQELFEKAKDYFADRAIIDSRAKQISAEIVEAWAFPFGDIEVKRSLFDAIKTYLKSRSMIDKATADLLVQLWAVKEEGDR